MKKIMMVRNWNEADRIMIDDIQVGPVDEFCYLGSLMTADSNCYKEVKKSTGKANAVFGKLKSLKD